MKNGVWGVPMGRYHQWHHFGCGTFPCWLEKPGGVMGWGDGGCGYTLPDNKQLRKNYLEISDVIRNSLVFNKLGQVSRNWGILLGFCIPGTGIVFVTKWVHIKHYELILGAPFSKSRSTSSSFSEIKEINKTRPQNPGTCFVEKKEPLLGSLDTDVRFWIKNWFSEKSGFEAACLLTPPANPKFIGIYWIGYSGRN